MSYSADDFLDKTLYAMVQVPAKTIPNDDAPITRYFAPGETIGVIKDYVRKKDGWRTELYWGFKAIDGSRYYTPHRTGYYDFDQLRSQGLMTDEEKKAANKPYVEQVGDRLVNGLLLIGGIWAVIKSFRQ